jgi:hypothetical protein
LSFEENKPVLVKSAPETVNGENIMIHKRFGNRFYFLTAIKKVLQCEKCAIHFTVVCSAMLALFLAFAIGPGHHSALVQNS